MVYLIFLILFFCIIKIFHNSQKEDDNFYKTSGLQKRRMRLCINRSFHSEQYYTHLLHSDNNLVKKKNVHDQVSEFAGQVTVIKDITLIPFNL